MASCMSPNSPVDFVAGAVCADVTVRQRRAGEDVASALRCQGSVTPGGQFVDPGDLVVSDALQHPGQPFLRIDTVELGSLDQGVGYGGSTPATGRADKEKILPAQGDWLHRSFGRIVIGFKAAMVEVWTQFGPARQGILNRFGQFGFARN